MLRPLASNNFVSCFGFIKPYGRLEKLNLAISAITLYKVPKSLYKNSIFAQVSTFFFIILSKTYGRQFLRTTISDNHFW
jgi:hypothetical protein